ncbi:unnamed protein product [Paramecium pentaurelia]|uniref:Uncharacterized protein n=1 Tax=Paramecium pentaurelia TaxID=43138 RepID=A0A8S1WVG6_9CILI|nr:unnamed protein product [Paramecium pentaurelia]
MQMVVLKWKKYEEIITEISQVLLTVPMGIILNDICSTLIVTLQLIQMKPSKFLLLKLSYVIILGMIMHGQVFQIVLICLSFLTIAVDIKLEQPKFQYSPTQLSNKKLREENELDKTDKSDKIHLQSIAYSDNQAGHRTSAKYQFLQILDEFPDGVALIIFDENRLPQVDFCNQTMMNLLHTTQQDLLSSLMSLKNLHIMKKNQQTQDLATSISTYKSMYSPEKNKIGIVRSIYRASTTVQNPKNEQFINTKLRFSKNPFKMALEQAILQIHSQEVQSLLTKTQIGFDLHTILNGYTTSQSKKDVCIEIKLFLSYLNDQPQLLILTRDVSYKDYIKSINQHSKAKSNSLNFVSHEIRTPIKCIIQLLEEIELKNDTIKNVLWNCYYLLNFSHDLLDLAQIKVGKFKLHKIKFNLEQLILQLFDLFRVEAKRNQIALKLEYDQDAPKQICNDDVRIKQVLINLIGNAFKFTIEGSITVSVIDQKDGTLEIKISDTGFGIREEDKKKLIKAFGRLDDDETKQFNRSGVGLGLLISNMICKSLSTKESGIKIESELYKGSSFSFEIDHETVYDTVIICDNESNNEEEDQVDIEAQPRVQRIYSNQAFRQRELLIIDDNQFNIDILIKLFNSKGINRIDYAINCQHALKIIDERIRNHIFYRVILLDIEMPIIDGFGTAKMIKQYVNDTMATMPVLIAVSGHGLHMKQQALNNGFVDYYEKPLKVADIEEIITRYLQ